MGPHPPLLLQFLRVPVRHRLLLRHCPFPAHSEGGRACREGLPGLPQRRLLHRPGVPAEGRGRGHFHSCPGEGRPEAVRPAHFRNGSSFRIIFSCLFSCRAGVPNAPARLFALPLYQVDLSSQKSEKAHCYAVFQEICHIRTDSIETISVICRIFHNLLDLSPVV